ncbi:hypothetical protein AAH068_19270 [Bacteroides uniformis]|uniref:hypothetical protein n=1 Tax=Bacteroides uniformis TaxID=820 RepID=UPI0039B4EFF8
MRYTKCHHVASEAVLQTWEKGVYSYGKWENGMEMAGRNPVDESKSDRTPVNDKTEAAAPSFLPCEDSPVS